MATSLLPSAAFAQTPGVAPSSVLLFPALVSAPEGDAGPDAGSPAAPGQPPAPGTASPGPASPGAGQPLGGGAQAAAGPAVQMLQESVTEALRKQLAAAGVSVVVYDRRLPSVQRAVNEGLRPDVAAGLRDPNDSGRAQNLAEIAGAREYITATIEDYQFDPATRTASFNLSVFRTNVADGATLGSAAAPGRGVAPADVAGPRQQGSAVARAAEAAAEQAVRGLFPRAPQPEEAPRRGFRFDSRKEVFALSAIGVIFGLFVLSR